MKELNEMADGVVKTAMEASALLCHDGDAEIIEQMEKEFNGSLGGDWYQSYAKKMISTEVEN